MKRNTLTILMGICGLGAAYAAGPEIITSGCTTTTTYTWDFAHLGTTLGGTSSSSTLTTTTETVFGEKTTVLNSVQFWELGTSILYDWFILANNTQKDAKLEFSMDLNFTGGSYWQTILHAGKNDSGFTLAVNSSGQLAFASNNDYAEDVSTLTLSKDTWTNVRFTLESGVAKITAGDQTVTVNALSDVEWDNSEAERNKYSIGVRAPGYDEMALNGLKVANMSVSLTQTPEPATATLSLLALAGLATRRRRKG
ncbi:MAG: PEP-CTERM sorting domain-containing protein [Akkermansia sp.]